MSFDGDYTGGLGTRAGHGALDGLTILRYAHAYETGGGVEQHLADLNGELSRRNSLHTIQMQLTLDATALAEKTMRVGRGTLTTVPLLSASPEGAADGQDYHNPLRRAGLAIVSACLRTDALNRFAMRTLLGWRRIPRRPGEPEGPGRKAAQICSSRRVDLVVIHAGGGAGATEVIAAARAAGIPVILIHHFSNLRLERISLRQQTSQVDGVAGASSIGVPAYLRARFRNLSDAVDTDFYAPGPEMRAPKGDPDVTLFAPGRFVPEKGQAAVLEVVALLRARGINPTVIFAGREDDPVFVQQLRQTAARQGLSGSVKFVGSLTLAQYRDWYGRVDIMLMPTRHHEGMPRTLIESQAMRVPPIVFDVGGTREGLVPGKTGYLVPAGDVAGIANAVEALQRNPDLYRKMASAGREFVVENFSLRAFAERHEAFYLAVIGSARGKAVTP